MPEMHKQILEQQNGQAAREFGHGKHHTLDCALVLKSVGRRTGSTALPAFRAIYPQWQRLPATGDACTLQITSPSAASSALQASLHSALE